MTEKKEAKRILSIEGFEDDEGIIIKYSLPKMTSDAVVDFYRMFITELCQRIGQLEGAEKLFIEVEDSSVE